MNKDIKIQQILLEMGFKKPKTLSEDQEEQLKRALDPEEQFLHDVEQLFSGRKDNA